MKKVLSLKFFERDTLAVAEELLGKYLVRATAESEVAYKITEVEAYDGPDDRASHASRGITQRTSIMYGKAGMMYVYFVYGMHHMLNIVTGKKGYPAAVLIRSAGGIQGPGRLAKALGLTREHNGLKLGREAGLWVEDRGEPRDEAAVERTPRIGVDYAGKIWAGKPYRFVLRGK